MGIKSKKEGVNKMNRLKIMLGKADSTSKSGLINMLIKPLGMLISIIYTPILLNYLGNESYGLWVTLLSIINWVNYFDVGIGNGLRNILSKELSKHEYEEARRSISTAYVVLSGIALVLLLILLGLSFSLNWSNIFKTQINMQIPLAISFSFICINFVLSLSNTLLYSLQLSERVAIRNCLIQCLNLIGLLVLSKISNSSLIAVAILYGSTTFLVNLFNTYSIFVKRVYLFPRIKFYSHKKISSICQLGIKFFIIQIMAVVLFTTDNLLISHYFGAECVTPFSIADKIFNTAYTVLAAFLVPYWSGSTVAFARRDYDWIIKSIKKVILIGMVFIIGYIGLLVLLKPLVRLWLGYNLQFQTGIPVIMCIFYSLYSILGIECQFINGSGKINTQLAVYCIAGIANIPLSIFLGVECGLEGFGIRLASVILIGMQVLVLGFNLVHIINTIKENANGN